MKVFAFFSISLISGIKYSVGTYIRNDMRTFTSMAVDMTNGSIQLNLFYMQKEKSLFVDLIEFNAGVYLL